MKYVWILVGLVAAASVATLARYESFRPCDWLEQDTARALGVPSLVAQTKIRAGFMLKGITAPSAYDCLTDWWRQKANGDLPDRS